MEALNIINPPHATLRVKCQPVSDVRDPELQKLIDHMIFTMRQANGVGLAAPQVDRPLQLTVIETPPETDDDGNEIEGTRKLYTVLNPEIVWHSRKRVNGIEGCLSIPGYVGEVARYQVIRVQGLDRTGKKLDLKLKGWTARIFQHEIDHLNGILYTDRLTAPENFWTDEEYEAMQKEAEAAEAAKG